MSATLHERILDDFDEGPAPGLAQLEQLSSTVREFRIFFVGEFGVSRLLLETEWAKRGWDVL